MKRFGMKDKEEGEVVKKTCPLCNGENMIDKQYPVYIYNKEMKASECEDCHKLILSPLKGIKSRKRKKELKR